jgi:hypothetical protein
MGRESRQGAHGGPSLPVPAQLPLPPVVLAGREDQLAAMEDHLHRSRRNGRPALVVITGAAGAGKTALALHWLRRIRDDHGGGQLYVDLRGLTAETPTRPGEPLGHFIRALGVDPVEVPAGVEEQAALFRSLTSGRRMIVMLDDAASAAQIRPLLPATSGAVVVVTTRARLAGLTLEGALFVKLGPLAKAGAVELLDRLVGAERTAAEPEATRSLAVLCGGLPLALCASGARLAARPRWPIARVAGELSDPPGRLAALSRDHDVSIQAVFDVSYSALPADVARVYRLLSLPAGRDLDAGAVAAAVECTHAEASELLDALVGVHLLEEGPDGRFTFHDLTLLHARGKAKEIESPRERRDALQRIAVREPGLTSGSATA